MICLFDIYIALLNCILLCTMYLFGCYDTLSLFIITLLSYLLHDLLTNKISSIIKFSINENYSNSFRQSIYDFIKYSSIIFCQNLLFNNKLVLSSNWFISNYSLILGYIINSYIDTPFFDLLNIITPFSDTFNKSNLKLLMHDCSKVTLGYLFQLLFTGNFNMHYISEIVAYIFFHLFTKYIIIKK